MAWKKIHETLYSCLSTDVKPTTDTDTDGIKEGAILKEVQVDNTIKQYIFLAGGWRLDLVSATAAQAAMLVAHDASITDHETRLDALNNGIISEVAVTGNKTLALTDAGTRQKATAAAVITVPPNSAVAFPVGTSIDVVQYAAGAVSVAAGAGVTINSDTSKLIIAGQYQKATLVKIATNEWLLTGALSAS